MDKMFAPSIDLYQIQIEGLLMLWTREGEAPAELSGFGGSLTLPTNLEISSVLIGNWYEIIQV